MNPTKYLLTTILVMHIITIVNITVFNGGWNGIVMAINTVLLILAFGLVLPLKKRN